MRRTRSRHIQRACNARGTYSKRIRHTPGTRRASRNFLSMLKNILSPNAPEACSDLQRRTATPNGRIPSVQNARYTRFLRVSDVLLAYVEFYIFVNTPNARLAYTLMSDCCFKLVLYLIHLDFVLKLYQILHQLYAALLGQLALFITNYCMEQVVQSQNSTMEHKIEKKILNGSCYIKFKNSCIHIGSTENGFDFCL